MKNLFFSISALLILEGSITKNSETVQSTLSSAPISIPLCYGLSGQNSFTDTTRQVLYNDLGPYDFKVSTKNELALKYFNQGIILYYGFNHPEAYRSFKEAARIDSMLAMAYWGQAICLGPNINLPMDPSKATEAVQLVKKARALSAISTQREKLYINALSVRYSTSNTNRLELDKAYAEAMKNLMKALPADLDAAALCAESLMDLHPWDFWKKNGEPQPWTNEITTILEGIIKKDPLHIGGNHFYIHAIEASPVPDKAQQSAQRLKTLVPGAGHLVHMPAHIFINTGQYAEATQANQAAIKIDEKSLKEGMLSVAYPEHNVHFLYAALTLEGASKEALSTANKVREYIPVEFLDDPLFAGYAQHLSSTPTFAMVRFGKWEDILKEKEPDQKYPYLRGLYHYAVGMACVKTNRLDDALKHHSILLSIASEKQMNELAIFQTNTAKKILDIAANVLEGEFYAAQKDYVKALLPLQKAMEQEEDLHYNEPADWPNPVKNNYGAVLLEAGKTTESESIYKKALKEYPENGWALIGLRNALQMQKKINEAADIQKRIEKSFAKSDMKLQSSRF